jgi:hypothetical protein
MPKKKVEIKSFHDFPEEPSPVILFLKNKTHLAKTRGDMSDRCGTQFEGTYS